MANKNSGVDFFADLAANHISEKKDKLKESPPMPIQMASVALAEDRSAPEAVPAPMRTHEELKAALAQMRAEYAPFLQDLSPELPRVNQVTELTEFVLDGKETITLPHYGGPVGWAVKNYETTFSLPQIPEGKAVYLAFGGVDYIATVYVNGECVGSHEGFFSPFEFNVTRFVKPGENKLRIQVENDYIWMGNRSASGNIQGDKMYAATGLGYDEPVEGWHHCPPGMGIYNYVRVEVRDRLSITDIYVRPLLEEKAAEIWVELENATYDSLSASFDISIYGQNFPATVVEHHRIDPVLAYTRNDHITFSDSRAERSISYHILDAKEAAANPNVTSYKPMAAMRGKNIYKIQIPMGEFRLWTLDNPWLYQAQVSVFVDGKLCDNAIQQFGMRSFTQDTENIPKGRLFLNGQKIKLRGANTMGFEQQDVLHKDFDQLIDDILIAKLCNMNFWRFTQRPVQDEVYTYCDRLGLMTQTDLPLFCCMRRTKLAELVRQAEEMTKLVRKHPCNVMLSYINEPQPDYTFSAPHRHFERPEMDVAFDILDQAVRLMAPEAVIKHVDGDYNPPSKNSIQDVHTYTLWYNCHEIEYGRLHRGYWVNYDTEWCCGCGEYGAEGLDPVDLMKRRYPAPWIAEPFDPKNIVRAQAGSQYKDFFERPTGMEDWVEATQDHQAFTTKDMTEAFRRKPEMVTSAIHLFIDAWPSGWMKAIMDCERTPKKAFFAYRDALSPVLVSLRSDRFTYYAGEKISIESYLCNDTNQADDNCRVIFELYNSKGEKVQSASTTGALKDCDVTYVANAEFTVLTVCDREKFTLKAIVYDSTGKLLSTNECPFEVFADVTVPQNDNVVLLTPAAGEHTIAGETVTVSAYPWDQGRHFVSACTGHEAVKDFQKNDFRFWYSKEEDKISPVADYTFQAKGFTPILTSNNPSGKEELGACMVVGEKIADGKRYIVSTLNLRTENPVAKRLLKALMSL